MGIFGIIAGVTLASTHANENLEKAPIEDPQAQHVE